MQKIDSSKNYFPCGSSNIRLVLMLPVNDYQKLSFGGIGLRLNFYSNKCALE